MGKKLWFALSIGFLALWGCGGPVISKEIRAEAWPIKGLAEVRQHPDQFKDKTIIVGGEIIDTINHEDETTTLIVLDHALDNRGRPEDWEISQGRFMVHSSQFLDPVVYAKGREVTVAGIVTGVKIAPVGETRYRYVVLNARQVYLWPPRSRAVFPAYLYWPSYYPDRGNYRDLP